MNTMYSTWCLDVDTDYYFLSWKKKKKKDKKIVDKELEADVSAYLVTYLVL